MKKTGMKILLSIILTVSAFSVKGCSDQSRTASRTQDALHSQNEASGSDITDTPGIADIPGVTYIPGITGMPSITGIPVISGIPGSLPATDGIEITEDLEDVPGGNTQASAVQSFTEASETVYAVSNVNIRSSCSIAADNIISVLAKGSPIRRTGIGREWSKVLFRNGEGYIKNEYLSLEKPDIPGTAANPDISAAPDVTSAPSGTDNDSDEASASGKEDFVAGLEIASEVDRLVVVIGNGGADCTVSYHKKDRDGKWTQQFSTDGNCGYKGISYNKKEGDGKTPAGLYSFSMAFGIKPDPGATLAYRQATEYDYWVDDIESPYYNTWVNSLETPGDYTSEHLIDHSPQYNYALNIDYNSDNTPGLGSAIFLHGYNGKGQTTGCVAISEKYVKTLVREADSSTMILIVPDSEALEDY
jgi:L,D-peptidoglycan transpeptidase YkuD (ErfK/YbiS/YcfS/YnhG family)